LKHRLSVILVVIVVLPLVILGWLGVRLARSEREMVGHRFHDLLLSRLDDIDADIAEVVAEREREVLSRPPVPTTTPDQLREIARRSGVVRQYFVLDPDGTLIYPSEAGPAGDGERSFLERTAEIWRKGEIPGAGKDETPVPPYAQRAKQPAKGKAGMQRAAPAQGWYVWYWGGGINFILWQRDAPGFVVGAELNPVRLMADIVGRLPDTNPFDPTLPDARVALLNAKGDVIYQWGGYEPGEGEPPQAKRALSAPLHTWSLEYYASSALAGGPYGRSVLFNLLSGLVLLGAAMIGLAVYYYRESAREMREAAQRVSFVNQVSHELKTPLTSIRMYAEMLDTELDDAEDKPRRYLSVIVAESQRLSRLIGNVLTFSRKQRSALKLHPAVGNLDEALSAIIDHFKRPLRAKGIEAAFLAGAGLDAHFDRDVLDQIVGNLLNNVEKYAVSADRATVTSHQEGDTVRITVADNGPGIPAIARDRVFEPFYRVSDRLTDGVAGTGIGLAIARDLARLHGGDLTLDATAEGACFRLVLRAPLHAPGR